MNFYANGLPVEAWQARTLFEAKCRQLGSDPADVVESFDAACQTEEGRELISEFSDYKVEVVS